MRSLGSFGSAFSTRNCNSDTVHTGPPRQASHSSNNENDTRSGTTVPMAPPHVAGARPAASASMRPTDSHGVSGGSEGSPGRFFSRNNEKLCSPWRPPVLARPVLNPLYNGFILRPTWSLRRYEAYSQLHTMAQDFDKPFDSPAILVVGHQTDGKSALVEALMGFQFNHVGGGTKTRRPIAINMKYSALCHEPRCYLVCHLPCLAPSTRYAVCAAPLILGVQQLTWQH